MNVGMVGLGKLGLPVAETMALKHTVVGYDVNPEAMLRFRGRVNSLKFLVEFSDIIFVAVQTPHAPEFEGIHPYKGEGKDFDYTFLKEAVASIVEHIKPHQTLVIISTVLPGTLRREIVPLTKGKCKLCYNPYFIAMGTEARDFLAPEFVLIGRDSPIDSGDLVEFYCAFHSYEKIEIMSIESAELTKIAYNVSISQKVALANALMEICYKVPGCDVDEVSSALKLATDRIVSPKYMDGGMGEGGSCHPRDGIAMSWLARELDLSYDPFAAAMTARTQQTRWLADLIQEEIGDSRRQLPVVLLGKAYKPESSLTTGSCGILLGNILSERMIKFEHYETFEESKKGKAIYFLATKHRVFGRLMFPDGSVVIDPFRMVRYQGERGIKVIEIGVGKGTYPNF